MQAAAATTQQSVKGNAPGCRGTHVMDLIVLQRDVILVDRVPLLDPQLLRPRSCLRREQLLQIADRVVRIAFDADLLSQSVVADDLDHA